MGFSALVSPLLQCLPELLGGQEEPFGVRVYGTNNLLDRLHSGLFKIRFAALDTHPSGDGIEDQVIPFAIDMKWCGAARHLALTIHARHGSFLIRKSSAQASGLGRYAVIMAKYP